MAIRLYVNGLHNPCNVSNNNKIKNTSYKQVNLNNKVLNNNASKNSQVSFGSAKDALKEVAFFARISTVISAILGMCDLAHIAILTPIALGAIRFIDLWRK